MHFFLFFSKTKCEHVGQFKDNSRARNPQSNNSLGGGAGTLGGRIGYHDEGGIGILPRTAINHILVCPK